MIGTRKKLIGLVGAISVIAGQFAISPIVSAEGMSAVEKGKKIAFNRKTGNCLACHNIPGGQAPGNIAPALIAMKSRFASKEELHQQIWDATIKNPESAMPPFGKHGIISEQQLNDVVEFVWTL
ncbi:MAG: sulfur oxidation c-type cytochrome SoxX [Candidatus Thiodiazotropha sp. (ex Notomyrtea botanica)]|nr:sulfur oxidation c-type cytochrome SoxX [Candidatus Thiodiazotropha sp. (ex Notomyrtea botanica)]MCU7852130.1 sulfur oxidation c-type cytochrome SoxX [Candidatus Thiodiazotropha sp. (ex Monitilora ramsayi)]